MKTFFIQYSNKSSLQIILGGFRKNDDLPLFCFKQEEDTTKEYGERIVIRMRMRLISMPFIDFVFIKELSESFQVFSNDPLPLKCYVEYRSWKNKYKDFNRAEFISYIAKKYKQEEDVVKDACFALTSEFVAKKS